MRYTVGIDVGGTHTVIGLVTEQGEIVSEQTLMTARYADVNDFVDAVARNIRAMQGALGNADTVTSVGIGAPAANYRTGCLDNPANLPWKGTVPLARLLSARVGVPVNVSNDANAAAMGEMMYGAARGMTDFILITLGTGVGAGIVADGRLLCGPDGLAGELGHVRIDHSDAGRPCGCGRKGCLETYCSAGGIVTTARELGLDVSSPKEIHDLAVGGNERAREVFRRTGYLLGEACADFAAFSSPQAFVFFGGPMHAHEFILPHIIKGFDDNVLSLYRDKPQFLVSELMERNAAVLGAAAVR